MRWWDGSMSREGGTPQHGWQSMKMKLQSSELLLSSVVRFSSSSTSWLASSPFAPRAQFIDRAAAAPSSSSQRPQACSTPCFAHPLPPKQGVTCTYVSLVATLREVSVGQQGRPGLATALPLPGNAPRLLHLGNGPPGPQGVLLLSESPLPVAFLQHFDIKSRA